MFVLHDHCSEVGSASLLSGALVSSVQFKRRMGQREKYVFAKGSKTGDTVEDHVPTTTQKASTQRQLRTVTSDASSSPRRVARASRGKTLVCQRRVVPPWPMGSMARELTALASPTIFF